jgi:hypothetical protein
MLLFRKKFILYQICHRLKGRFSSGSRRGLHIQDMFITSSWKKLPDINIHIPQLKLDSEARYRPIPLPSLEPEPLVCMINNMQWDGHGHFNRDLPELECHIAPRYAVINTSPKGIGLDLHQVARDYLQSGTSDT